MLQALTTPLREALQCSLVLLLLLAYPGVRERFAALLTGVFAAFVCGFFMSYMPGIGDWVWGNETWTFIRYLLDVSILYLAVVFLAAGTEGPPRTAFGVVLFVSGFMLFFFEARAEGFLVHDIGLMKENVTASVLMAMLGTAAGFSPLLLYKWSGRIPLNKVFNLPSLLLTVGALRFAFGGVGEIENENLLASLQRGLEGFLINAVSGLQQALVITEHPFIDTPFATLAAFLSGDRVAMTLMLAALVSRPDPVVGNLKAAAERRLHIAFFRREIIWRAAPVLVSFIIILVLMHTVNVSLNPLSEPVAIPVREADAEPGILRMPLSDRLGDFTDGNLRKYVYYYGDKQIIYLAILKPDGTVGVALDECEICKPADWNKAAQGYAQRGGHLVCKYCMTPIPIPTVNKPGGCNPIPVPFRVGENDIEILLDDLIRVYRAAKAIDKKGTHL
jgi:hypothetical protein